MEFFICFLEDECEVVTCRSVSKALGEDFEKEKDLRATRNIENYTQDRERAISNERIWVIWGL